MKSLDGKELAGYIKERQFHTARSLGRALRRQPKLLIIRDSDNPVIVKYVNLKKRYGEDIGVEVEDFCAQDAREIREKILTANEDMGVDGIIVQLPIRERELTDELMDLIASAKDVDGLANDGEFDSATATAINWLLAGYGVNLMGPRIALVGRGKLVGAPLYKMWTTSGYDVSLLHRGDDLTQLIDFDIIVTATGVPGLITSEMVREGAVVVDAGTASEGGVLVGDVAADVRARDDLAAITPQMGGVGPLTVTCLFEHVLEAAEKSI